MDLPKVDPTTGNPSVYPVMAQMSRLALNETTSAMVNREESAPLQVPIGLTPTTHAATTKTHGLIDHKEAHLGGHGAGEEVHHSQGIPASSHATSTSGQEANSSYATSYTSSPTSHSGSDHSLSGAARAEDLSHVPDLSTPSSPTLFPGPLERAALRILEASEQAAEGVLSYSHGLKRSREARDSPNEEEDEASPRRKAAKLFEPSDLSHDIATPFNHGLKRARGARDSLDKEEDEARTRSKAARLLEPSELMHNVATPLENTPGNRKRSRATMAGEERDQEELLVRKKMPRTTTYIDLTTSENDDTIPENVVDLTVSQRKPSLVPSQQLQESYLHRLPGELRNRIYRDVGLRGARLELRNLEEPALAVAIPDLKDELHSVIFSANKLRIPVYSGFRADTPPDYSNSKKKKAAKKEGLGDFNNSPFAPGMIGISPDSWVMKVDPRFVTIKHICLRILESHESAVGHKHLCDFFLNVCCSKAGEMQATCRIIMVGSDVLRKTINNMSNLAKARAKQLARQEGFQGFTWEQLQHIAASFVSVADAKSRYTRKAARITLL